MNSINNNNNNKMKSDGQCSTAERCCVGRDSSCVVHGNNVNNNGFYSEVLISPTILNDYNSKKRDRLTNVSFYNEKTV